MGEIVYDKLVRDRIPEIVARDGKRAVTRVAGMAEHGTRLAAKLVEEAGEFRERPCVDELADVMECVVALCGHHGFTLGQVEAARVAKRAARGGFDGRIVLEKVVDRG